MGNCWSGCAAPKCRQRRLSSGFLSNNMDLLIDIINFPPNIITFLNFEGVTLPCTPTFGYTPDTRDCRMTEFDHFLPKEQQALILIQFSRTSISIILKGLETSWRKCPGRAKPGYSIILGAKSFDSLPFQINDSVGGG